ncbi:MAG: nucleoside phosphorylase [bacterium]
MIKRTAFSFFVFLTFFQCVTSIAAESEFTAADLPIVDGKIYHLSLKPEQLAPNIIIVGDPERVPLLADYCLKQSGRIDVVHRGLHTITGTSKRGLPVTIVTTGMGTPSTEIVLNELIILNEIDLQTRKRRINPVHETLNIIRLGTSGALQPTTELGTLVITEYAIGLDNTGLFYNVQDPSEDILKLEKECKEKLNQAIDKKSRFYNTICPYAAAASPEVVQALCDAAWEEDIVVVKGITISNSGFFANQGRDISRIQMTIPKLDKILAGLAIDDLKAENMEMEASFICHFAGALGYRVGAICPTVCNRCSNTFYNGSYEQKVLDALKVILRAFEKLN